LALANTSFSDPNSKVVPPRVVDNFMTRLLNLLERTANDKNG